VATAPAPSDAAAAHSSSDPVAPTGATPTDAAPTTVSTVAPPVPVAPPIASAPPAALAPTASAAPVPAPVPLQSQIAGPVFTLAQGTAGEQTITITVTPENLGPVTVSARTSAGSMHIELFAPSDAGREALRVLLTDLRRDLAVAGIHTSLNLSTQTAASRAASSDDTQTGTQTGPNARDAGAGAAAHNSSNNSAHNSANQNAQTTQQQNQQQKQQNQHQNTAAQNEHNTNQPDTHARQSNAEALSDRPAIGSYRSLDVMT
jgi:flagellar hook-length control protein FliK